MILKFISYCSIILIVTKSGLCDRVPYEDCNSKYEITSIEVPNCNILPCIFTIDSMQDIIVNMTSTQYARSLNQKVQTIIKGIKHPITNISPLPCTPKMPCPIYANTNISLKSSFQVPDLPPFVGNLQWELMNPDGVTMMCFRLKVQILP